MSAIEIKHEKIKLTKFLVAGVGWQSFINNPGKAEKIVHLGTDSTDGDMFAVYRPDGHIDIYKGHLNSVKTLRDEAEEFLQSKGIWHHPYISDGQNKNSYEVAGLIAEFANTHKPKQQ